VTLTSGSVLAAPAGHLSADFPGILVHTGIAHAAAAADVCAAEGMGAVLSVGRTRQGRAAVDALLEQHQGRGAELGHVLLDAEAYAGANRARGADPIDSAWVRMQWAAGCQWALTNSGFVDEADLEAMNGVLHAGAAIGGQTITALPIHPSWLKRDARGLSRLINAAGQPVALMVQHSADPFGVRDTVRGLITLLDYTEVCARSSRLRGQRRRNRHDDHPPSHLAPKARRAVTRALNRSTRSCVDGLQPPAEDQRRHSLRVGPDVGL
jgi:hypothetical protein